MLELSNTILIAINKAESFASDGDKKFTRKRSHKFENGIKEKKTNGNRIQKSHHSG